MEARWLIEEMRGGRRRSFSSSGIWRGPTVATSLAFRKLLRRCAAEVTRDGDPVRYVRSIFLPEDETCLDLFVASSANAVGEATRRAGVSYDRIVAYE